MVARENQLRLNVEQSPGLKEVQARIVSYRRARSPAEALEGSLPHVQEDWVLLCHQDVYFPAGFGERLNAVLDAVPAAEHARTLIGFAGMGVNRQTHAYEKAGFRLVGEQPEHGYGPELVAQTWQLVL